MYASRVDSHRREKTVNLSYKWTVIVGKCRSAIWRISRVPLFKLNDWKHWPVLHGLLFRDRRNVYLVLRKKKKIHFWILNFPCKIIVRVWFLSNNILLTNYTVGWTYSAKLTFCQFFLSASWYMLNVLWFMLLADKLCIPILIYILNYFVSMIVYIKNCTHKKTKRCYVYTFCFIIKQCLWNKGIQKKKVAWFAI